MKAAAPFGQFFQRDKSNAIILDVDALAALAAGCLTSGLIKRFY